MWELRAALTKANRRSAPGSDGISNSVLSNLSDEGLEKLLDLYNKVWEEGALPEPWKVAKLVLIPKHNKPPDLEHLRPISITSCVCKLLEHMILRRWQAFLESKGYFPSSMIGFREGLGAQDAMLIIKHEVVESKKPGVILGLDLKSAFDRVTHEAILTGVSKAGLGNRSFAFVKDFLSNKRAKLVAGDLEVGEGNLDDNETKEPNHGRTASEIKASAKVKSNWCGRGIVGLSAAVSWQEDRGSDDNEDSEDIALPGSYPR
ncbi:hypothetical protein ISCGN_002546 [Ixodes scapularis]